MLRAIFAALASGLRHAWSFATAFMLWPFALFSRPARTVSSGVNMSTVAAVEKAAAAPAMKHHELVQSQARDARLGMSWITVSLLTRSTQPFPPALSKTMRAWLQGLNHAELSALKNAGNKVLFEHCYGKTRVAGVPPLQPLAQVAVKYPVEILEPDAGIAEIQFRPT